MKQLFIFVVFISTCFHRPPAEVYGQLRRQNSATIQLNDRDFHHSIYNHERSQETNNHRNFQKSQQRRVRQQKPSSSDDATHYDDHINNVHQLPPKSSYGSQAKQHNDNPHPSSNYLNNNNNQQQMFGYNQYKFDTNNPELLPSCSEMNGFSPGQIKICQLYPDHVLSILQAVKLAAEECQFQFSMRRWNCSLLPWGNNSSLLAPPGYLKAGSKEVSVVKAYLSAAITYATARACREGLLSQCSCSRKHKPKDLPEDWVWGGCGDNTEYGFMFGVGFVDSKEKEMNHPRHSKELLHMLSNIHNNQVGRRTVVTLSKPGCKCHGVSGSCSLKTCWHQLPSFRIIGQELRNMYDSSSVMVKFNKAGTNLIHSFSERKRVVLSEEAMRKITEIKNSKKFPKNSDGDNAASNDVINGNGSINMDRQNIHKSENAALSGEVKANDLMKANENNKDSQTGKGSIAIKRRVYRQFGKQHKRHPQGEASKRLVVTVRRPSKDELVFTSQSTNFCEPTQDGSWPGTKGRLCKRGSTEPDSCDLMCCGRGYNTFRTRTIERCNCQFVWCCHVQCSSCEKFTDIHVCK